MGGVAVAPVGSGLQLLDAALRGEQIAQPVGGGPVARVGSDAQLVDAALRGEQIA
jgi:hypothetical protein